MSAIPVRSLKRKQHNNNNKSKIRQAVCQLLCAALADELYEKLVISVSSGPCPRRAGAPTCTGCCPNGAKEASGDSGRVVKAWVKLDGGARESEQQSGQKAL